MTLADVEQSLLLDKRLVVQEYSDAPLNRNPNPTN